MKRHCVLKVRVFGTFGVYGPIDEKIDIRSRKACAILATLVCSPSASRTRSWLQEKLWERVEPEHASGSLRQALHALKQALGPYANDVLQTDATSISLVPGTVEQLCKPSDGEFLEGFQLSEVGFTNWLEEIRAGRAPEPWKTLSYSVSDPMISQQDVRLGSRVSILPFQQISGPMSNHGVLGDMLAEEITRSLSRSRMFDVISHLSSRSFSGPIVADISKISKQLSPEYIVTGTLRVNGDSFFLDLDFTDVLRNQLCWSESYRGVLSDFLKGTCPTLIDATTAIAESIVDREIEFAKINPLPAIESHQLMMASIGLMHRAQFKSFSQARTYLEELIKRHPSLARLQGWLAHWHILSAVQGWTEDQRKAAEKANRLTQQALSKEADCSFCLTMDGFVNAYLLHEFDLGFQRLGEAISQHRSNALATLFKGVCHAFIDEGEEAVLLTERACRLSPLDPEKYFYDTLTATAHLSVGNYQTALDLADVSLRSNPRHLSTYRVRAIALQMQGRGDEARAAAQELLRRDPQFSVSRYLKNHPAASYRTGQTWAEALLESGVPKFT